MQLTVTVWTARRFLFNAVELEKQEIVAPREKQLVSRGAYPPGVYQRTGKFEILSPFSTATRHGCRANCESSASTFHFHPRYGEKKMWVFNRCNEKLNFSTVFFEPRKNAALQIKNFSNITFFLYVKLNYKYLRFFCLGIEWNFFHSFFFSSSFFFFFYITVKTIKAD